MPKAKPKPNPLADLVDEYGRLEAKLAPIRPDLRRFEAVAKLLRSSVPADADSAATVTLAGATHEVMLGAASLRTVVAPAEKLYKKLGRELFLKVANVTLTALKDHVHPATVAAVTSEEQSGPRKIAVRLRETRAKAA